MGMDHAEAHERIADLALDRDALARLGGGSARTSDATAAVEAAFLAHVRGCARCEADLAGVRALDARLRDALAEIRDSSAVQPIHPPEDLRDAVLEAARLEPRTVRANVTGGVAVGSPRRWRLALPRLTVAQWAAGLALAVVVAVLGGFAGRSFAPGAGGPDPSMVAAMATLDRVMAAPDHHVASLTTPAGVASGSVAWSAGDFVVLTSALAGAEPGHVYRCWLLWAGRSEAIGEMAFAGGTAFWTGSPGSWASLLGDPATRLVVTAEAAGAAGAAPAGPVMLQATLGS